MTAKTKNWLKTCFSLLLVALVLFGSTITAGAVEIVPSVVINLSNPNNIPFDTTYIVNDNDGTTLSFGTQSIPVASFLGDDATICTVAGGYATLQGDTESYPTEAPDGDYLLVQVMSNPLDVYDGEYILQVTDYYGTITDGDIVLYFADTVNVQLVEHEYVQNYIDVVVVFVPITGSVNPPQTCPTLEEQIAGYTGTWDELANIIQANNSQLYSQLVTNWYGWYENGYNNGLNAGYNNGFDAGFSEGHTEGYAEGYNQALNGNAIRDPIDQYWNSTKDYILIAGQPYFAPNGFGSIDEYNTVGIYGEYESKLNKRDGTTQSFNGQYVTQFASAGTLGGGWYKIGATVGDENAYEQSFNVSAMDKAYYVARVSPLGDPVEEFLVAIWLDGYEAWYVAEEYVHYGTVANNNKSYKQVYSIYMTDIRPTAQRFINYDTPVLHETFNEDINATLYLATFNQLNNYNVYTDGIGIVESYNNGFDAGANTTLWLDLLSQPIVAFFSIPLAQVIVEGVTYTLTYGIVLGAGIVALIVVWFLKLFAGG